MTMDSAYRNRAAEWVKWYMYNRSTNMPLERKVEFQQKCIHGLFEMLARTIEELERIEEGHDRPQILMPTSFTIEE